MSTWKHALLDRFAPYLLILALILVLVLNSALVVGIQVAAGYPYQESHAAFPDKYELLDVYGYGWGEGRILWVDDQQWRLIITEKHFRADRWRTVCDMVLTEQNFSGEFPVQAGKVSVQLEGYGDFATLHLISSPVYRALHVPGDYLLWNGGLLLLEMIAFFLFRKLRGS